VKIASQLPQTAFLLPSSKNNIILIFLNNNITTTYNLQIKYTSDYVCVIIHFVDYHTQFLVHYIFNVTNVHNFQSVFCLPIDSTTCYWEIGHVKRERQQYNIPYIPH